MRCEFLQDAGYPPACLPDIRHAIEAHSFSAGIAPRTVEAKVVQDADRLDALGAIGLARCIAVGTALGRPLYEPEDPFCRARTPDDGGASVDHFYAKLLKLAGTMQTAAGRREAERRTAFLGRSSRSSNRRSAREPGRLGARCAARSCARAMRASPRTRAAPARC